MFDEENGEYRVCSNCNKFKITNLEFCKVKNCEYDVLNSLPECKEEVIVCSDCFYEDAYLCGNHRKIYDRESDKEITEKYNNDCDYTDPVVWGLLWWDTLPGKLTLSECSKCNKWYKICECHYKEYRYETGTNNIFYMKDYCQVCYKLVTKYKADTYKYKKSH